MISGEKKIVIYAKQDIELGEEITYGASAWCIYFCCVGFAEPKTVYRLSFPL